MALHCTLQTAHCALRTANCQLHTVHCTLHTAHYTLQNAHCTLHTAHCTLRTVHSALCTAHCAPHTAHCTLHTAHCAPGVNKKPCKRLLIYPCCTLQHTIPAQHPGKGPAGAVPGANRPSSGNNQTLRKPVVLLRPPFVCLAAKFTREEWWPKATRPPQGGSWLVEKTHFIMDHN
jgi:hypothetical protein